MFTTKTESNGRNTLSFTGILTAMSDDFTSKIMSIMASDEEAYGALLEEAKQSPTGLDEIIKKSAVLQEFFDNKDFEQYNVSEDDAIKILKSQQSKRSRSKSKDLEVFTHFKHYMSAYIAELIIRKIANIEGSGHAGPRATFSYEPYTDEELAELKLDQYKLTALVRNVQSRKCTLKKEETIDEVALAAILVKEEQLKSIRDGSVKMNKNVEFARIQALFENVVIDDLKVKEAKELLHAIVEQF